MKNALIDAPAEVVWQLLSDLPGFASWNPFIREARGTAQVGTVAIAPTHRQPQLYAR